jgi:hypothetical protein
MLVMWHVQHLHVSCRCCICAVGNIVGAENNVLDAENNVIYAAYSPKNTKNSWIYAVNNPKNSTISAVFFGFHPNYSSFYVNMTTNNINMRRVDVVRRGNNMNITINILYNCSENVYTSGVHIVYRCSF